MRKICLPILITTLILTVAVAAQGKTIYVDRNVAGANNGTSWQDAYVYLQDALADANSSPKPVEVLVAQGTYKPDRSSLHPEGSGDNEVTFNLISGVSLKGGYAGVLEPDVRDTTRFRSILNGDLLENDVSLDILNPSRMDNSECVVDGSYTDRTAILDGFEISGGYLLGRSGRGYCPWTDTKRSGGGVRMISGSPRIMGCVFCENNVDAYVVVDSDPLFSDCVFENHRLEKLNKLTGTMVMVDSGPVLEDCIFQNCTDGAVYCIDTDVSIERCRFQNNSAFRGGAVYCEGGNLTIKASEFHGNTAERHGGAIYCDDVLEITLKDSIFEKNSAEWFGAVRAKGSIVSISGCLFRSNTATVTTGALYAGTNSISISDCVFQSNTAEVRGGISLSSTGTPLISDCIFEANTAKYYAGAVYSSSQGLSISRCLMVGNRVKSLADGDYAHPDWMNGTGSAVLFVGHSNDTVVMTNCTLAGNSDSKGVSIAVPKSQLSVRDSIIWDENAFAILPDINFSNSKDSIVFYTHSLSGNIGLDPCFVNPGYWDPNGTTDPNDDFWVSGDYHLKSQVGRWDSTSWVQDDVTSPCIDAGDPMSPIGPEPFPNGGIINMGVYGATSEASKSYFGQAVCETIVAGDINGDCVVDFRDMAIMMRHWLEAGESASVTSPRGIPR